MRTVTEEQEGIVNTEPVLFGPREFTDLAEQVNPYVRPIPHGFLRFDCTDMEKPLREILYESGHWVTTAPQGDFEWDVHQETSIAEGETEDFLKMKGETGVDPPICVFVCLR